MVPQGQSATMNKPDAQFHEAASFHGGTSLPAPWRDGCTQNTQTDNVVSRFDILLYKNTPPASQLRVHRPDTTDTVTRNQLAGSNLLVAADFRMDVTPSEGEHYGQKVKQKRACGGAGASTPGHAATI